MTKTMVVMATIGLKLVNSDHSKDRIKVTRQCLLAERTMHTISF